MKLDVALVSREVQLLARYKTNHRCYYCGRKFSKSEHMGATSFTVDHIIPLSRGGSFIHESNLAPCCLECNRLKNNMTIEQWRKQLGGNFKFYFEIMRGCHE